MRLTKQAIIIVGIVLLFFAVGSYFYTQMPDRIAAHWNAQGQADGYMSRFWGLFLVPLMAAGMSVLLVLIPSIDPLRANIDKFKAHYYGFVIVLLLFLFYLYLLTILWNLGARFNMIQLLAPAFGILFYYCGVLMEKAKRNWFIGIRTPWTLNSEVVWDKTHRIGGRLFKAAGILSLIGILFPSYAIFLILVPAILLAFFTIIYSYVEYQKETRA